LREAAREFGAVWYGLDEQFGYAAGADHWTWWGPDARLESLPLPALPGPFQLQNAAGVLMALLALGARLPLTLQSIRDGLSQARIAGRFTVMPGAVEEIYDVAHNPHGAKALAAALAARPCAGRTMAVCAMLADKDASGVASALAEQVQAWYLAGLDGQRGQSAQALAARMPLPVEPGLHADPASALAAARAAARPGDRIVIFGSFLTIAELLPPGL
jgi:dihydrofolate synthase/folylpolyglutamate synthase